jgi:hypothetical protein
MWVLERCKGCGGSGFTGSDGQGNRYVCELCDGQQVVFSSRQLMEDS